MVSKKEETRIEKDSISEMEIPVRALWGHKTARYVSTNKISDKPVHRDLIVALAQVKMSVATTNSELNLLKTEWANAIEDACKQIIDGQLFDQIIVDSLHGAGGIALNNNLNEVIANLANQTLGSELGSYSPIHPTRHVNLNHTFNDGYVTAMRLSILSTIDKLNESLLELERMLRRKSLQFERVLKTGRVFFQDASPITLGQEFNAYGSAIEKSLGRIKDSKDSFREVVLGGAEIGTGFNTDQKFSEQVINCLSRQSNIELKHADDYFRVISSMTDFSHLSSSLKDLSIDILKIVGDLRVLCSGPRAGIGELGFIESKNLDDVREAPYLETVAMVCQQVIGNDLTVSQASQSGLLEANSATPLIIDKSLESIDILACSVKTLSEHFLANIEANQNVSRLLMESSPEFSFLLQKELGEKQIEEVVKKAKEENLSLKDYLQERNLLPVERLEKFFSHRHLTSPGRIIPFIEEETRSPGDAPAEEDKQ